MLLFSSQQPKTQNYLANWEKQQILTFDTWN